MKKIIKAGLLSLFIILVTACTPETEKEPDIDDEDTFYEITFQSNADIALDSITIKENEPIGMLPEIDQEGYIFRGWYLDTGFETPVDETFIVTKDLTLYALWADSYTNPVYFGPHGADPHIIRHEDKFYVYVTGGHIIESTDMVNWEIVSNLFPDSRPNWGTPGAGLWAPDIVKIGDKFMIYYSHSTWGDPNPGIGVMSADHPKGPWTDHGKLFNSNEIGVPNSIDANVFVDGDDVYMIWGSFIGTYMVELTSDGMSLKNGVAYANEHKIHIAGFPASTGQHNSRTYEGAYIIKKDTYYYLFLSTGDCCPQDPFTASYEVVVARSKDITGPYVDHLGRDMRGQNLGSSVVSGFIDYFGRSAFGPGHNSIIIDDNQDYWIVYHSYFSDDGLTHNSRQIAIDKLIWSDDLWPYVENQKPSVTKQETPYFNN